MNTNNQYYYVFLIEALSPYITFYILSQVLLVQFCINYYVP